MERIALALAHGDAGVADVVGDPVRQDGNLLHIRLLALDQLIDLLLSLGKRGEATIVLIHLVKPKRLVLPARGGRHHQLRGGVEEIDHVRLALEGNHIVHGEGIGLAAILVAHRRGAFALVELELHILSHRDADAIDLADGRLRRPERNDVVELSAHRRDETRFVVAAVSQQSIRETLLGNLVFHDVARVQPSEVEHDLPRPPVDGTGRSRVVASLRNIDVHDIAALAVNRGVAEFGESSQRVVVVLHDVVGHRALFRLNFKLFVDGKRPRTGLGHLDCRAVEQRNAVGAGKGGSRQHRVVPLGLRENRGRRQEGEESDW